MEGWIKLHRKIVDNPYYFSEPFTRSQAWVDLIILANHKDNFFYMRGVKVDVKRGQIGMSLENIAKRFRWSRGKAERFISELEKSNQIVRQKTNITTLFSIVNYNEYQSDSKADSNTNSKSNRKADGHQTVKQTDTNKNEKNDNNEKNEDKIDFDVFWNLYNKKVAKDKCISKWDKLSSQDHQAIIDTLPNFLNTIKDKQFQPHPDTYLNQKRWKDEQPLISVPKTKFVVFSSALGKSSGHKTEEEIEKIKSNSYFTILEIDGNKGN